MVAERELRPRADGAVHARRRQRLHRARRARAGARADRLRQRLEARRRHRQLPLRRQAPRPGAEARLRQDAAPSTGRTPSGSASTTRKHPSFFVDKLWRYFVPTAPDAATRRSLEALYRKDFQIRPVVEAILLHPAAPRRAADGEAAGRLHRRPAARARPRRRHPGLGRGSRGMSGQRLFMPPNVSGWDDERWLDTATFRGRWEVANYASMPVRADATKHVGVAAGRAARRSWRARSSSGAPPRSGPRRAPRSSRFATKAMGDADQRWKKTSYPLPDRERAPPAARRLPRPPDLPDGPLLQRLLPHRPDAPRRGRGRTRAACDRGRDAGAGGHRARPPQLPRARAPASRSPSTAAPRSCRARSRRASPRPPRPGPQRVLVSVFLDGGADSLSMLFPSGDPLYRQLRPRLVAARSAGVPFAEDDRLRWHPSLAGARDAARRREGERPARRRLHRPRPVALHLAPLLGGRRDERAAPHRLARPLPRPRRLARQPAAGPLARVAPPAVARDREDAGRVDRRPRPLRLLDAQRLGRRATTRMLEAIGTLGATPDPRRPRARAGDVGGATGGAAATSSCCRSRPKDDDQPGFTSPVAYPKGEDDEFPRRLAGLAAMLGAGPARARRRADGARACTTPTTTSRTSSRTASS